MEITKIGVHHFAGNYTLSQVNLSHKQRWPDFPSRLRPDLYVGYNIIIWKDGSWIQTRFIGEETAAAKGANTGAVHIALAGDFNVDKPSWAQKDTLKRVLVQIVKKDLAEFKVLSGTTVNVKKENVFPHRLLGVTVTDCYGSSLADDWARLTAFGVPEEIKPLPLQSGGPELSRMQKTIEVLKKLIESYILLNKIKLGGQVAGCTVDMRG